MKRLVKRNADKPHRCPSCHRVVTWEMRFFRVTLSCGNCCVRWFYMRVP